MSNYNSAVKPISFWLIGIFIVVSGLGCLNISNDKFFKESEYLKDMVKYLSNGNLSEIQKYSISDAHFLKSPLYLEEASKFLKDIDIDSLRILQLSKDNENPQLMFVKIYFENDKNLFMNFHLQLQENKMLMRSFMFSDFFPKSNAN